MQGPMTSIAARYSGLQRPSLSDKAPNSGDDMTASSMGSVLMKPDSVGSTPCCCNEGGAEAQHGHQRHVEDEEGGEEQQDVRLHELAVTHLPLRGASAAPSSASLGFLTITATTMANTTAAAA